MSASHTDHLSGAESDSIVSDEEDFSLNENSEEEEHSAGYADDVSPAASSDEEEYSSTDDLDKRKRKIPFAKRQEAKKKSKPTRKAKANTTSYTEETYDDFLEAVEEFTPKRSSRKKKSVKRDESFIISSSEEEDAVEFASSGDERNQNSDEEVDEEEVEEAGEPVEENVVEKILAHRVLESGENEYYVKWKGRSYIHVSWVLKNEFSKDRFGKSKLLRYHKKNEQIYDDVDDIFNASYVEVDRVITHEGEGDTLFYLTKWNQLPYADATWETPEAVGNDEKIQEYLERNKPIAKERWQKRPHPGPTAWQKYEESPNYKHDHQLRSYQLEGLNWLTFCWYNKTNSILADEMGLGKTVQTVSVMNHLFTKEDMHGPFLIIAPLITVPHWQREFEGWTDMNTIVYHGNVDSRQILREFEWSYSNGDKKKKKKGKSKGFRPPFKFNVLITTFEMIITDVNFLGGINWKYIAVDEAHRLKNKNCKLTTVLRTFSFDHLLLLTGTPLQNNTEELWTLLNLLDPQRFASSYDFAEQFGNLKESSQVDQLHKILRPYLLRRMKEDVEKSIAPKEETIIEVELTTIQKKYYRAIFEKNFTSLNMGGKASNVPSLLNVMMQLRKCCNHPYLLRGVEENILKSRSQYGDMDDTTLMIKSSGKLALIDKLLSKLKSQGHKVLIFSQMVRMLDILEDHLIFRGHAYERIDGSKKGNERQEAIDRFSAKGSDRFVFLLCTRAGGLGINLTAADTCIIYDSDWNPQNDIQAQARCHRIGQTQMVKIYRLLTRNTYEKKMFEKASLKLGLDQAVLTKMKSTGGTASAKSNVPLNAKEVNSLLKHGAYGAFDDAPGTDQYDEEDIDNILERSTTVVVGGTNTDTPANNALSSFSKASFTSADASSNAHIDVTDPDFWKKLMPDAPQKKKKMAEVPRRRKQVRRYGNVDEYELVPESSNKSDSESEMEEYEQIVEEPIEDGAIGWNVRDRNRLRLQLQVYGYCQWHTVRKAARLDSYSLDEVEAYAEALTRRFIEFLNEDPTDGVENLRKNHIPERYTNPFLITKSDPPTPSLESSTDDVIMEDAKETEESKEQENTLLDPSSLPDATTEPNATKEHSNEEGEAMEEEEAAMEEIEEKEEEKGGSEEKKEEEGGSEEKEEEEGGSEEKKEESATKKKEEEKEEESSTGLGEEFIHNFERDATLRGYEFKEYAKRNAKLLIRRLESIAKASQGTLECLKKYGENIKIPTIPGSVVPSWTEEDDRSLILGTYFHGYNRFAEMRQDERLSFSRFEDPEDVPVNVQNDPRLLPKVLGEGETKGVSPGKELWPSEKVLNRRLRKALRLILMDMNGPVEHIDRRRRTDIADEWSKREKLDFYRVITTYGVRMNEDGSKDLLAFKRDAKLTRKSVELIESYCNGILAQSSKAMELAKEYETKRKSFIDTLAKEGVDSAKQEDMSWLTDGDITLSIAQCKRILQRVKLFEDLRVKVLPLGDSLPERLKDARKTTTLPAWWNHIYDNALIIGVIKHGFGQWEKICKDDELPFFELAQERIDVMELASLPKTPTKEEEEDGEGDSGNEEESKPKKRKRGRQVEVYTNALGFPKEKVISKRFETLIKHIETKDKKISVASLCDTPDPATILPATPEVKRVPKIYQDVPRDKDGGIIFPIVLGKMKVLSLGRILPDQIEYHNSKYIWAVGYRSIRPYFSFVTAKERTEYTSEILEGDDNKPCFSVTAADAPDKPITGTSATAAWTAILKLVKEANETEDKSNAVSGPEYFGLARSSVRKLIQDLPGATECQNYQLIDFRLAVPTKRARKKRKINLVDEPTGIIAPIQEEVQGKEENDKDKKQTKLSFGFKSSGGTVKSILN